MTKLTLGIPLYNSAKFLPELFDSIIKQTGKPDNIIFLDDCSLDNSLQLVQNFSKKNPSLSISIFKNERNLGVAGSYNRLIRECTSQWLHILDADDYLLENFYSTLLPYLNNTECGVIAGGIKSNSMILNFLNSMISVLVPVKVPSSVQLLGFITSRSALLYNTKHLPLFTDPLFDGSDIIHLSFIRDKRNILFIRKARIFYRIHPSAVTGSIALGRYKNYIRSLKGLKRIFHSIDFYFRKKLFGFIRKKRRK